MKTFRKISIDFIYSQNSDEETRQLPRIKEHLLLTKILAENEIVECLGYKAQLFERMFM